MTEDRRRLEESLSRERQLIATGYGENGRIVIQYRGDVSQEAKDFIEANGDKVVSISDEKHRFPRPESH